VAMPVRPVPLVGSCFLLPSSGLPRRRQWEVATTGSSGNPSGGPVRRVAILRHVVHLGRGRRGQDAAPQPSDAGQERRIEALEERIDQLEALLEERIDQLEALLEGLQDAVHRESVREGGRIGALEKKTEPPEISRALNRDARERGL
jgi:hypothetical protein